jgi:cholesterol oxidase
MPTTSNTAATTSEAARPFDYDVLVVGSGFGGSVTALRLIEKGYRVGVLEAGRRFTSDIPEGAGSVNPPFAWGFSRVLGSVDRGRGQG